MQILILFCCLVLWSVDAKAVGETLSEKLVVWPLPNRFNLLQFQYEFDIPLTQSNFQTVDKFPRQILDLMRETGDDVRRIEANLVQGRW